MEEIKFSPLLLFQLDELVKILYNEEYFGFEEDSVNYVNNLIKFIYTIPSLECRKTKNVKYGSFYCKYRHNKKTSWYIIFDVEEKLFIIRYIINNHSVDYPLYIM